MKILILAVGRVRDPALAGLCEDYAARVRRYGHRLTVEEVREEPGSKQTAEVLTGEAGRLRSRLAADTYTVALDPAGEACDSPGLARRLNSLAERAVKKVAFLVGGHLGLDPALVSGCDWALSLSPMTFPHELARLILLEQLYRANTILRGEPYHK
ncbi:MAG: 23S rRNA (pseudouridine(1915)-N(3))-methyltransferase RlmH [Candidatus Glassbacteria bacterium]|nr:23S rRNA (pseudouridine(1915)-N(3))-methyltransferase RlmH [Candidatus Glassbacteria bacterium]